MNIFGSMLHGFLPFSVLSLTESCSFWKDLVTLHMLADKVGIDHSDDVTSGRRDMGPHWRLRAVQGRMG